MTEPRLQSGCVIAIEVPADYTALPVGGYTDCLRVAGGASSDLFKIGSVLIAANSFVPT